MWGQLCLTLHRGQTWKHLIYAKSDDRQMMMLWGRASFYWLSLAAGRDYNRTVLEQKIFIWRVLGTLSASMTRSRASSSPSRMLKSISSSDLDRLSIFMLDFEDTWKGEDKNLDAVNQITKKWRLCFDLHPCSPTSQIEWQLAVLLQTCDVVSLKFLCTLISQLCSLSSPPPAHHYTPTPQWPHLKHPTVLWVNECTLPSLWKEIKAAAVSTPCCICGMCGKTRVSAATPAWVTQIFSALKCNKCSPNFLRALQSPNSFPRNEVILERVAEHVCIMRGEAGAGDPCPLWGTKWISARKEQLKEYHTVISSTDLKKLNIEDI